MLSGEEWEQAIDTHPNSDHLILILISPDFMASDYCFGVEMKRALERHQAGICRVVPILLRPTFWEDAPFSSLQLLPSDARPITRWPDRDEAFQDITTEINRTIKDLLNSLKTKQDWMKVGHALYGLKRYEEALAAFEQAIRLDPTMSPPTTPKAKHSVNSSGTRKPSQRTTRPSALTVICRNIWLFPRDTQRNKLK